MRSLQNLQGTTHVTLVYFSGNSRDRRRQARALRRQGWLVAQKTGTVAYSVTWGKRSAI